LVRRRRGMMVRATMSLVLEVAVIIGLLVALVILVARVAGAA
jgi:hypothetical protein